MLTTIYYFAKLKIKLSAIDENAWNFYFSNEFIGNKIGYCNNCNISIEEAHYYLYECKFYDYNDQIIVIRKNSQTLFLHNRCSFSNCIFYVSNSNSSVVQRKFCGTKCACPGYGQFSSTILGDGHLNFIIESSLFDVGNDPIGYSVCEAWYGIFKISSINFSSCIAREQPVGIFQVSPDNYIGKFIYTTTVNNFASDNSSFGLTHFIDNVLIFSCNFINNSYLISGYGIIFHESNALVIQSCSFINNTRSRLLTYLLDSNITVDNCYIENLISDAFGSSVEPQNPRTLFTNYQQYFAKQNLHLSKKLAIINL